MIQKISNMGNTIDYQAETTEPAKKCKKRTE